MTVINRANEHNVRKQISGAISGIEADILAVESDVSDLQGNAGYALFVQTGEFTPTDATVYYFGAVPFPPSNAGSERRLYIPRSGTITRLDLTCYAKTAGSNESWSVYIRVNDTTETIAATVSTSATLRYFTGTGLAIAVSAGDYIEIKTTTPTWVTDPAGVYFGGHVYVK